MSMGFFLW